MNNALYGSFLPIPSEDFFPAPKPPKGPSPGAVICLKEKIKLNAGRKRWFVEVKNEGDRPIQAGHCFAQIAIQGTDNQVGSHYPFLETNPSLVFDRLLSYGMHLDIPAGTAVRFEPGERKTVSLVQLGGKKLLSGGSGLGQGPFDEAARETRVKDAVEKAGFGHKKQDRVEEGAVPEMDREVVSCLDPEYFKNQLNGSTHRCLGRRSGIGSNWVIWTCTSKWRRTTRSTVTSASSVGVSYVAQQTLRAKLNQQARSCEKAKVRRPIDTTQTCWTWSSQTLSL